MTCSRAPLVTILHVHFLQHWYALSELGMEEALYEMSVMRHFAHLGGLENSPDETTILNFRRLLETHELAPQILERVGTQGPETEASTIFDAAIIAAPSSIKSKDGGRYPDSTPRFREEPDHGSPRCLRRNSIIRRLTSVAWGTDHSLMTCPSPG